MSLWQRLRSLFGQKANAAVSRFEDPGQMLDMAYDKQAAALADVRRGVAEVLTSEKRLELEAIQLRASAERAAGAARDLALRGDDPSARRALEREAFLAQQHGRLCAEIAEVRTQREALESSARALQERVEMFRSQRLALRARYTAAKAAVRAGETLTGLSAPMAEVSALVERAREKALETQARAEALAQLADTEAEPGAADPIDPAQIEARLSTLKAEAPKMLEP